MHALLRHLRGQLSLHASAVSIEGRAAVFIGASGSGKSTFAAYLGGRGYAMLADDVAHIDRAPSREGKGDSFLVQPSEVAHYLMQDACEALGIPAEEERAKTRVVAANVGDKAELAAMFCFVDADDIHVTRLTGFQTIEVLSPCVARFVFDDPGVLRADLERLGALLSVVPKPLPFREAVEVMFGQSFLNRFTPDEHGQVRDRGASNIWPPSSNEC